MEYQRESLGKTARMLGKGNVAALDTRAQRFHHGKDQSVRNDKGE